eukprot:Nk52_evm35s2340 gene=Nk52_evmTU35s2340
MLLLLLFCITPSTLATDPIETTLTDAERLVVKNNYTITVEGKDFINIPGGGATSVKDIYLAWITQFQVSKATPHRYSYESVGSGEGQKKVINKEYMWAASDSVLSEVQYAKGEDLQMFPIMAGAVVLVYNYPGIGTAELALSRATVAGIYLGTITHWDDAAIKADNPGLTFGNEEIMLVVRGDASGTTEILTEGLASFSTTWNSNVGISNDPIWPKKHFLAQKNDGMATRVYQIPNSIGYVSLGKETSKACTLKSIQIINKAGRHTIANSTSIQSASADYETSALATGDITRFHTTLIDGPGVASYPFVAFTYVILHTQYKSTTTPCPLVVHMIRWFYWFTTDRNAIDVVAANSYVALTTNVQTIVILLFNSYIYCDRVLVSQKVFTSLTGSGASFPAAVYAEWVAAYTNVLNDESYRVTYSSIGSGSGRANLYANNTVYAGSDSLVKEADYTAMPGLRMFPSLAGAVVLIYNVPEIETATDPLVLSRETIGEIFMGTITTWNDPKIVATNPSLSLPSQQINLIVRTDKSGTVEILTRALDSFSSAWSNSIGVSSQPSWPKATISVSGSSSIPKTVLLTNYSMSFTVLADARGSACFEKAIRFASIINRAGTTVQANTKSIQSAMDDYVGEMTDLSRLISSLSDGGGKESYPIAGYTYIVYYVENGGVTTVCPSIKALLDYAFWFLDDSTAAAAADSKGMAVLSTRVKALVKELLWTTTCAGVIVRPKPDDSTAADLTQIYTLIGIVVGIGLIVGYIFYRVRRNQKIQVGIEKELNDNSIWKIELKDIEFKTQGAGMGSQVGSMASMASMGSKMSMGSQKSLRSNKKDESEKQVFTVIGKYNGVTVAVKKVNKTEMKITREIQKEFRMVRELQHPNLNPIIGGVVEPPEILIISEYCPKGSLQDVVHNDVLKLDAFFKYALCVDLCKGMKYLHDSDLTSFGRLQSSNCLIDSKWVLRVTDYGLHWFREEADVEQQQHQGTLYMAPELLNEYVGPWGSQKGDVYSYGVVIVETFERQIPFHELDEDVSMIVDQIRVNGIRPNINREHVPKKVAELIHECWIETPSERPSFDTLEKKWKIINPNKNISIMDNMAKMLENYAKDLENVINRKCEELEEERIKKEAVLFARVPKEAIDYLLEEKEYPTKAYPACTIFVCDVIAFNEVVASVKPDEVTEYLNHVYKTIDHVLAHYSSIITLETINDAYMCCCGIPKQSEKRHAGEVVTMCLHLLSSCYAQIPTRGITSELLLRMGVHTGPVVAGIIGAEIPRYCLFGESVKMSHLVKSVGAAHRVVVSETTRKLLVDLGNYTTEKHKEVVDEKSGKKLQTYLVTGKKKWNKAMPPEFLNEKDLFAESGKPSKTLVHDIVPDEDDCPLFERNDW